MSDPTQQTPEPAREGGVEPAKSQYILTDADLPPDTGFAEPENALPEMTLDGLPDTVRAAANRAGWSKLMPVQAKSIPYLLAGRDMMVQAKTGSGKTGAFLLPILSMIDPNKSECQALVMVPTRELAQQVYKEALALSPGEGFNAVAVYGGVGYGPQIDAFRKGAHLVVGTPGRILDHLMQRALTLDHLKTLIFDEADRMMSMGFYPDMTRIRRYLPKRRSGFMFSATFPTSVRGLANEFFNEPGFLSLSEDSVHITGMHHVYYEVPAMDKDRCLVRIIEVENPASAIIFCNTKDKVNYVSTVLQRFGYDADQLTADLSQRDRERVLERLRQKKLRFLVATDVAARGIDISQLSHVVLYEVPQDPESYIHRAGRTARAGATGVAMSLVALTETAALKAVARQYGITMECRPVPTDEDVQAVVTERMTAMLEAKLRGRDRMHLERMKRLMPLARSLGESDDELALIAMLLDDYYQETLHAPPPEPEGESEQAPANRPPRSSAPPRRDGSGGSGGQGRRPRRKY
ncbi:MAG: DEAD/DEAH box helicase [Candidatus Sumerlaeaceae bacterium]|nr:DEAD/DEAH box helicase [Candidatus Sumerlaeaceae bacterium]